MGRFGILKILTVLFVVFSALSSQAGQSFLPPIPTTTNQPTVYPTLPEPPFQVMAQPSTVTVPQILPESAPAPTLPEPPIQLMAQTQSAVAPLPKPAPAPQPVKSQSDDETELSSDDPPSGYPFFPGTTKNLIPLTMEDVFVPVEQTILNHGKDSNKKFNGVVLVAQGSNILFRHHYGNVPHRSEEYASDTPFLLASATKEFTAALVLKAVEDGKLQLEDPISKFFRKTPRSWEWSGTNQGMTIRKEITIAQLLNHTSGLGDYLPYLAHDKYPEAPPCFQKGGNPGFSIDVGDFSNESPENIDAISHEGSYEFPNIATRTITRMRICTTPGSKFAYSNTNYFLLGKILEKINHKFLSTLFKEQITDVLGMTKSRMIDPNKKAAQEFYDKDGTPQLKHDAIYYFAVGNIYSSLDDLFLWERGIFESNLIIKSDELRKKMVTPVPESFHGYFTLVRKTPENPNSKKKQKNSLKNYRQETVKTSYGYGVRLYDLPGGKRLAWHAGHIDDHTSLVAHYLEDDITVIILTNSTNAEIFGLEGEIAKTVFNVDGLAARCQDQVKNGCKNRKRKVAKS